MSDSSVITAGSQASDSSSIKLPISSIVRAVCEAANAGPDLLYEVMVKMSLMVESTAPTYGLSIWSAASPDKPSLRWAEGLEEDEISAASITVGQAFANRGRGTPAKEGDSAICLLLAMPSPAREGAALYGRCVHPLSAKQAKELNALSDVAQLAHSHLSAEPTSAPGNSTMSHIHTVAVV